jgi:hypothetical protein
METTVDKKDIPMRYSVKSLTIHQLAVLINQFNQMDEKNDFQALLMTPFGLLKCDIDFKDNAEEDDNSEFIVPVDKSKNLYKVDLSHLIKIRHDLVKKMTEEDNNIKIIDNGATLSLKNVEIFKDSLTEPIGSIGQMLVFADQISAFTLVPRNSN